MLFQSYIQAEVCVFFIYFLSNRRRQRHRTEISGCLFVFLDSKNMDIAVGISLLSCTEAVIDVISDLLPVNVM